MSKSNLTLFLLSSSYPQIDEPDTPYRYHSDSDAEHEPENGDSSPPSMMISSQSKPREVKDHWEEIQASLNYHHMLQSESDEKKNSNENDIEKQSNDCARSIASVRINNEAVQNHTSSDKFKDKRAAHYNEYMVLKTLRRRLSESPQDDEEEDTTT